MLYCKKEKFEINIFLKNDKIELFDSQKKSLFYTRPDLVKEWHPTKNKFYSPEKLSVSSTVMIWWKCSKGHEWKTSPNSRRAGGNCPYCAGIKLKGDLKSRNPELAKMWHPTKNGDLKPNKISFCSGQTVWWKCSKGHEWQASVYVQKRRKFCPCCKEKEKIKFKPINVKT